MSGKNALALKDVLSYLSNRNIVKVAGEKEQQRIRVFLMNEEWSLSRLQFAPKDVGRFDQSHLRRTL